MHIARSSEVREMCSVQATNVMSLSVDNLSHSEYGGEMRRRLEVMWWMQIFLPLGGCPTPIPAHEGIHYECWTLATAKVQVLNITWLSSIIQSPSENVYQVTWLVSLCIFLVGCMHCVWTFPSAFAPGKPYQDRHFLLTLAPGPAESRNTRPFMTSRKNFRSSRQIKTSFR